MAYRFTTDTSHIRCTYSIKSWTRRKAVYFVVTTQLWRTTSGTSAKLHGNTVGHEMNRHRVRDKYSYWLCHFVDSTVSRLGIVRVHFRFIVIMAWPFVIYNK